MDTLLERASIFFRMPSRFAVYMVRVVVCYNMKTARALDNKWFRRSISDRDRFSTWQNISDDVASASLPASPPS